MLSIITAVYQGQAYMAACIESVLSQNFGPVEHIIMDGGSTDGTVDIVKDYMRKHPHIRFISGKDQGQSDALNKGIKLAQGNIIGILNVDDFYEPGVFKEIYGHFDRLKEPALLVGNCKVLDQNDRVLYINKPSRLRQEELLLGWNINQHPANPSAYFYHKSLHEKIGLYEVGDHHSMDLQFILKAVAAARVLYVDQCWGNFRFVPGTKTYEDVKAGTNKERAQLIYESFIDRLPLIKRCWVRFLKFRKTSYYYYRMEYYLKNPLEIFKARPLFYR